MLCKSSSTAYPQKVTVETPPDKTIIRLTDNVKVITEDDKSLSYEYDQVEFILPDGREETSDSIADNFHDWWLYGLEDHTPLTLEERVSLIEDILMDM